MKRLLSLLLCLCLTAGLSLPATAEDAALITLSETDAAWSVEGVTLRDSVLTISRAGSYTLTGTLTGQLAVALESAGDVTLTLRDLSITCADGPALLITGAEDAYLVLEGENRLVSGEPVEITRDTAAGEDASGAALQAKCDLHIDGTGTLFIGGYLHQGIRTSKDLSLDGGTLTIEAVGSGIRCKDKLRVSGSSVTITSGGDGIHAATEATDTEEADGDAVISGGTLTITALGDAIQSETSLTVSGGTLSALTGGGSAQAVTTYSSDRGRGFDFGFRWDMDTAADDTPSTKGLKAGTDLTITGGTITLDCLDDALHAGGTIAISGGALTLSSGDDGVHSDGALTISGGTLDVLTSYEGLEGNVITVEDGIISVVSSDDGLNASGGTASAFGGFAMGGKGGRGPLGGFGAPGDGGDPGAGMGAEPTDSGAAFPSLVISGGTLRVNAQGDGLDSNGNLLVSGGLVLVDGPSSSGNGALDAGTESGGTLSVTGGTVLAIGAGGMAEAFGSGSTQPFLVISASWQAGDELVFTAADGTELLRHTAAKSGQSIVFSCPGLQEGDAVTVTVGSGSTTATAGFSGAGAGRGGFGGGSGGRKGW